MHKYILLVGTGYVESASLGSLPVSGEKEYASAEEAIYDFGKAVWTYLEQEREYQNQRFEERIHKPCCLKALETAGDKSGNKFCSKCGGSLGGSQKQTHAQEVVDFVHEMTHSSIGDGMGEAWDFIATEGWTLNSIFWHSGKVVLVEIDNFQWHPNFTKYGLLNTEWRMQEIEISDSVRHQYHNTKIDLYEDEPEEDEDEPLVFDFNLEARNAAKKTSA